MFCAEFDDLNSTKQVYKYVTFNIEHNGEKYSKTWLVENLYYLVDENGSSACYGNNRENCKKYGRLYTWNAALSACPIGWHLPSLDEWEKLLEAVPVDNEGAGMVLKAGSLWKKRENGLPGVGSDRYDFAALPGGLYEGVYQGIGTDAIFWTSSMIKESLASYVQLRYDQDVSKTDTFEKVNLASVRCIQDDVAE